jgi:zinc transport system substrate-binding protein
MFRSRGLTRIIRGNGPAGVALRVWVVGVSVLSVSVLSGCASGGSTPKPTSGSGASVVASFYPLAFIAERIGGDRVRVANLTPPGAEPHDLELSPDQLEEIDSAAVAVVLGKGFQPSAEKAVSTRSGHTVVALESVLGPVDARQLDPHIWLDPSLLPALVDAVERAMAQSVPAAAALFQTNAIALKTELVALDRRYTEGLATCQRRVIVTSHDAFGRMAIRYRLTTQGIAGFSPDAEPSPGRLAQLADLVKKTGVTTVFTEQLVSSAVARTLARETGTSVEVLNPLESAPKAGDYFSEMGENLRKLRKALGCT